MTTDAHRIKLLKELLAERILVLDGAFGTFVLGENLSATAARDTKDATRTSCARGRN